MCVCVCAWYSDGGGGVCGCALFHRRCIRCAVHKKADANKKPAIETERKRAKKPRALSAKAKSYWKSAYCKPHKTTHTCEPKKMERARWKKKEFTTHSASEMENVV